MAFWYKKRMLAVLFLLSEIISFVLDKIGGSNRLFLVASFLLSAIGFVTTIYTSFFSSTVPAVTRSESERQLIAVEIVFSFIQLVITYIQLIRVFLGAKSNNNESLLPLAFAVISVVFIFRNNEEAQVVSDSASVSQMDNCGICLERWRCEGDHQICCLHSCGHLFGYSCIIKWVQESYDVAKCPLCRMQFRSRDVIKIYGSPLIVLDEDLRDRNQLLEEEEELRELKAERNELRDEKQMLKAEKEKLEWQVKAMIAQPSFLHPPPAIPDAFVGQGWQ